MTDITLSNLKPVSEFVTYIMTRLHTQNNNWWEIAQSFAEAREMFGFNSDSFKRLCLETKFSKSKASKLATIAQSERLKQYADKLSGVHSWGTLYAITTLDEGQFQDMKQALSLDDASTPVPFITQAEVERFKRKKPTRSAFKNYAVIQVDEEALKGGLLTGSDCEELNSLIDKIEAVNSHITIRHMKLDEKDASSEMIRLCLVKDQLVRKEFFSQILATLSRHKKLTGETNSAFQLRILGENRDELLARFDDSPKTAFEHFGFEYDEARFFAEAEKTLWKRAQRNAQKAIDRTSTLTTANTPLLAQAA